MDNLKNNFEIDGNEVFNWFLSGSQEVYQYKQYLNAINIFPVADGDTGTNLATTLNAMISLSQKNNSFHIMMKNMSDAALAHARGNSGILFASYINGLSLASSDYFVVSKKDFSVIAKEAVSYLYEAVSNPIEGTIISVIRDWADFLMANHQIYDNFLELFEKAYECAIMSLDKTKSQLPILKKHQVVDSGAKGFVTFLDGINQYLNGTLTKSPTIEVLPEISLTIDEEVGRYRYCTEVYLAIKQDLSSSTLGKELQSLLTPYGDSLIISSLGDKVRIHIHTDSPARIVEMVTPFGSILEQKADNMHLQNSIKVNQISKIGILTDSIADLPDDIKLQYQIHTLPIGLLYKETDYLDKLTISLTQLESMLKDKKNYPTSSQPEPGRVHNLLEQLLDIYDSLIIISVSSKMSGTYQTLEREVKKINRPNQTITLIDSRLNSGAQGLLVKRACEYIAQGLSHEQVVTHLEKLIPKTSIYVCLHTLENAVKSGRVPNSIGILGMKLGLRPIMTIDEHGKGSTFSIGFSQKSITNQIMKQLQKKKNKIQNYCIVHADNIKLSQEYEKQLTKLLGKSPDFISEISSVVAIHAGLGSVAVSFIEEE